MLGEDFNLIVGNTVLQDHRGRGGLVRNPTDRHTDNWVTVRVGESPSCVFITGDATRVTVARDGAGGADCIGRR